MVVVNNVVFCNGMMGMVVWLGSVIGAFVNNIVVQNGMVADEWVGKKMGVWYNAFVLLFDFCYNVIY